MDKKELYKKFQEMKEIMGAEKLLEELFDAMTSKEIEENLSYIDRVWDLNIF